MIGFLRGRVAGRGVDFCLLDVAGVGYRAACSGTTLAALPRNGSEAHLWTYLHVRDDALVLFGFASEDEQRVFEALIGVPGVGPKGALAVCSTLAPNELRRAVATEDAAAIAAAPGVGKKIAQRVIIDLKQKLQVPDLDVVGPSGSAVAEARSALQHLGYSPPEIRAALEDVDVAAGSVEAIVRDALRALGRKGAAAGAEGGR